MKKLLLLFGMMIFVALGTVSCSDDDDGGNDRNYGKILGTWKTKQFLTNGVQTTPSTCSEFLEYTFHNDGSYKKITFTGTLDSENDPEGDDCTEASTINGTWDYKGDDTYLIHDNTVEITDANESEYTFVLNTAYNNTELNWFTVSDYQNAVPTKTVYIKQ